VVLVEGNEGLKTCCNSSLNMMANQYIPLEFGILHSHEEHQVDISKGALQYPCPHQCYLVSEVSVYIYDQQAVIM